MTSIVSKSPGESPTLQRRGLAVFGFVVKRDILISIMLCAGVVMSVSPSRAGEEAEALKLKRIGEEMAMRRKQREDARANHGVAFTPVKEADSWFKESMDLQVEDQTIGACCQTFATLARKEVLASSRVVKKRISIAAGRVDGETALIAFRRAMEAQGVAIVPVGDTILVLVEAGDIANEKKG
jgi:hypothetical protein